MEGGGDRTDTEEADMEITPPNEVRRGGPQSRATITAWPMSKINSMHGFLACFLTDYVGLSTWNP